MRRFFLVCILMIGCGVARGQSTVDTVGATALRAVDATLTGEGVVGAQIESAPDPLQFEINPSTAGQPFRLFSYQSTAGASGTFPNRIGSESSHADDVAFGYYAVTTGVAPGLKHLANYETDYFWKEVIIAQRPVSSKVFNQSFELGNYNAAQDQVYDNYIARFHSVVASGIGDGGPVLTPSDCYNGLGVAAYGGNSSTGPTIDGRCKPDITAPAGATSYSTPVVSGGAAVMIQAGRRLGLNAAMAVDSRTVKALLLNGAVKPSGWTHTSTSPLDPNYGAGIMNIYNSYEELTGGRQKPTSIGLSHGTAHAPLTSGSTIAAARAWDYRALRSTAIQQGVSHYHIMTTGTGNMIGTLVWNRRYGQSKINQLQLYLYDSSANLLASSVSTVDNVQHLYVTGLNPGSYDLEVVKLSGRARTTGVVSPSETYALAWDFER